MLKTLAPRFCRPLCDLESITFPLWVWVASSVNGGGRLGSTFPAIINSLGERGGGDLPNTRRWRTLRSLCPPPHLPPGGPQLPGGGGLGRECSIPDAQRPAIG